MAKQYTCNLIREVVDIAPDGKSVANNEQFKVLLVCDDRTARQLDQKGGQYSLLGRLSVVSLDACCGAYGEMTGERSNPEPAKPCYGCPNALAKSLGVKEAHRG